MATIKKNKVTEARVRKEKGCIEAALEQVGKDEAVQNRVTVFEAKGLQLKGEALTLQKKKKKQMPTLMQGRNTSSQESKGKLICLSFEIFSK